MWHYIYVLHSSRDGGWYVGYTTDLQKRLGEHNGNKVRSTKGRGPFEIIYSESCKNPEDALAREKYLKSGMGRRYIKNRIKRFLTLTG